VALRARRQTVVLGMHLRIARNGDVVGTVRGTAPPAGGSL
jgi:hypothetical protein